MTVIARFEVIPVHEGSMTADIARAIDVLDRFDVAYETTPMGTILEANTLDEIFAAARAAHDSIGGERVVTSLEIDDHRGRRQHGGERVASVENELGRSARRDRPSKRAQGDGEAPGSAPTAGQSVAAGRERGQTGQQMHEPRGRDPGRSDRFEQFEGEAVGRNESFTRGANDRERQIREYERSADRSVARQRDQRRDRSGRGYRRY